jgi:hypothetical protein
MTDVGEFLPTGACAAPGCSERLLSERQQRPLRDSTDGRGNPTRPGATVGVRVCAAGHEQRDYYS